MIKQYKEDKLKQEVVKEELIDNQFKNITSSSLI